ncbi:MAG TPA: hypothetical protein VL361_06190 [Candidatus Limnocylindrales bacterium]|jgi:hypothetical protein|nr:hypothetical protein [Candidatus Limnocylindrales bacterium]
MNRSIWVVTRWYKSVARHVFLAVLAVALCPGWMIFAQENVTIPKSRLQELEEKERELNRLKGDITKTKEENTQLKKQQEQAVLPSAPTNPPEPIVIHQAPPMASLPGLRETDQVDAMDLAEHYRIDSAAADARYRGHKFILRGEIAGFEKPILKRDYKVLLKTGNKDTRVLCSFYPPEKFNAIFTADHGAQLVGLMGETRVPLLKAGQEVFFRAECQGWKGSVVIVSGGEIHKAK